MGDREVNAEHMSSHFGNSFFSPICDLYSGWESNDEHLMGSLIFTMGEPDGMATSSSGANGCAVPFAALGTRVTNAPGNWEIARLPSYKDNRAGRPRITATLIGASPNDYVLLVTASALLFNDGKKPRQPGQRGTTVRSFAKARKRGSPCIIKGERVNLSNTRYRNFPRDAPCFSYRCNGESFTPGLPTAKDSPLASGRKSHTRACARNYTSKTTPSRPHVCASKMHTLLRGELGRRG